MLYIKNLESGIEVFKALGSEIRVSILCLLLKNKEMNLNEIAGCLNITNGALTSHIKKLEDAGLISVTPDYSGHGNQKICRVKAKRILLDIVSEGMKGDENAYESEIPVGQYTNYSIFPTCGISTSESLIGEVDDPRYFAHPERVNAGIFWFSEGYVEYVIPNLLPAAQKMDEITLSMELSSEAPGVNSDWPSDIIFSINNVEIGMWTSPGDFGDRKGIFTPEWWSPSWNQYGLLKTLSVDHTGTYIDKAKVSDITIDRLGLDYKSRLRFRMEVKEAAAHAGGLTVFGKGFGNYNQGIRVWIRYSPMANGAAG